MFFWCTPGAWPRGRRWWWPGWAHGCRRHRCSAPSAVAVAQSRRWWRRRWPLWTSCTPSSELMDLMNAPGTKLKREWKPITGLLILCFGYNIPGDRTAIYKPGIEAFNIVASPIWRWQAIREYQLLYHFCITLCVLCISCVEVPIDGEIHGQNWKMDGKDLLPQDWDSFRHGGRRAAVNK